MKYLYISIMAIMTLSSLSAQDQKAQSHTKLKTIKVDTRDSAEKSTQTKSIEKDLEITKEVVNGKEQSMYILRTIADGKEKITKWNGQGAMPIEIQEVLDDSAHDTFSKSKKGKTIRKSVTTVDDESEVEMIIIDNETGKYKVWKSEGDMPEDVRVMIVTEEIPGENPDSKVKLGLHLTSETSGVTVSEVLKESLADGSGIQAGDVILKLNGKYQLTMTAFLEAVELLTDTDAVSVTVIRDDEEVTLVLK